MAVFSSLELRPHAHLPQSFEETVDADLQRAWEMILACEAALKPQAAKTKDALVSIRTLAFLLLLSYEKQQNSTNTLLT